MIARYSVFMTSQHTDTSDLSVVADAATQVWSPGSPDDGLDARLEIAKLDEEARVASGVAAGADAVLALIEPPSKGVGGPP